MGPDRGDVRLGQECLEIRARTQGKENGQRRRGTDEAAVVMELTDRHADLASGTGALRLETRNTAAPSALAVGYGKVWVLTCGNCNDGGDNQKLLEFDPALKRLVKPIPAWKLHPDAAG